MHEEHFIPSREAIDQLNDGFRELARIITEWCDEFTRLWNGVLASQIGLADFLSVNWDATNLPETRLNDAGEIEATTTKPDGSKMVATFKGNGLVDWVAN